ncbi:ABC transporter ATP-binding protein/permease [Nocardia sp. SSK8]|uniref:ABC transporter ATP-binding protein/permease n=1 Tax=Nocardia sp. SSK8 TaxID=3120154 RepID=UPI003008763F
MNHPPRIEQAAVAGHLPPLSDSAERLARPARGGRLSRWAGRAGMVLVGAVVVAAVVGPWLAPYGAEEAVGMPFAGPGGGAVLGTDRLGRDVLSHLLTGGLRLLVLSALIAALVTVFSAVLGAVAAVRPRAGRVIELAGDLVILLPAVLGILLVLTAWPDGGAFALVIVSLLFGVPYCARLFAAAAATIAKSGYVEAAVAAGESLLHLVFREILPNLRAVFTTQLGLRFVVAVYLVSTVAFLGLPALGADNWAIMVRDNAPGILLNPWSVLAPSITIAIVAVGVNLVVTNEVWGAAAPRGVGRGGGDTGGREGVVPGSAVVSPADEASAGRGGSGRRDRGPDERGESSGRDRAPAASGAVGQRDSVSRGGRLGDRGSVDGGSGAGESAVVEGLTVVAESGAVLLAPLSFRLEAGSVTALTGASGAGKSTAMRALLGHLPAGTRRGGKVLVAGHEVFALDERALRVFRREKVAYVGQDPGSELNPLLRVRVVLAEAAPHASDAERLAVLDRVGLDATFPRRRCGRLSGGQQRRVALARALLRRPEVLILDEPFAGLHGALRADIARLITDLATQDSTAVLLSGHDTTTVHAIADTLVEVHPPSPRSSPTPGARGVSGASAAVAGRGPGPVAAESGAESSRGVVLRAEEIGLVVGGQRILDGVGLAMEAGAAVGLVGPSGAGKTTLARVISGLQPGATGLLEVAGVEVPVGRSRRVRPGTKGIHLVTQNPLAALNPRRTVHQTLARPLRRIARVPRGDLDTRVTTLLADVDLPADLATRRPHELSGGQRQRVALARALAAHPSVLICDEITTALDAPTAAAIMTLLDRLRTDHATAILLISHDMSLVAHHCTDLVVLDNGRIVESGTPAAILAAPAHRATADLLG